MKQTILTLSLLSLFALNIQASIFDDLLAQPQYTVSEYEIPSEFDCEALVLEMDYADSRIGNLKDVSKLRGKQILRIDLVYTDFSQVASFDQPLLNRDRLKALWTVCRTPFDMSHMQWRFIAQTKCSNKSCAEELFHGFVITYREYSSAARTMEMDFVTEALSAVPMKVDSVTKETRVKTKKKREATGMYLPRNASKRARGIRYSKPGIWDRRKEFVTRYDSEIDTIETSHYSPEYGAMDYVWNWMPDTTFLAVMERNPDWTDMHIFCDVTGSMSPYTAQVLTWLQLTLNERDVEACTFFNDGDNMPDRRKKIGSTGGIYHTDAADFKAVQRTMTKAMTNGGGGDAPENNVEALVKGVKEFGSDGDLIMVADNWAPLKDQILLEGLDQPVHVVLGGTLMWGVNIDYINLAYATGGSVHTIEEDLTELAELNEGAIIELGGSKFVLKKGKFEPVYRL